jgi:hypothetical protein
MQSLEIVLPVDLVVPVSTNSFSADDMVEASPCLFTTGDYQELISKEWALFG